MEREAGEGTIGSEKGQERGRGEGTIGDKREWRREPWRGGDRGDERRT